jgi:hypothetical protein
MSQISPNTTTEFQQYRPEIYKFASDLLNDLSKMTPKIKGCVINAPVKSGKRIIEECLFLLCKDNLYYANVKFIHLTSLDRLDCVEQLEELRSFGFDIASCNLKESAYRETTNDADVKKFKTMISNNERIIVCIDECDYGSGVNQALDAWIERIFTYDKCQVLLFSATAYETEIALLHEATNKNLFLHKNFIPPTNVAPSRHEYHGAEWFLNQNLIHDPQQFIHKVNGKICLTQFAKNLCDELVKSEKRVGVVRLIGKKIRFGLTLSDVATLIQQELNNMYSSYQACFEVYEADQTHPMYWGKKPQPGQTRNLTTNYQHKMYECLANNNINEKFLILIDSCATRSTEIGFHKDILFWVDDRKTGTKFNTYEQAVLRVCHYSDDANSHKINVYADKEIFEMAAKIITKSSKGRGKSSRIKNNIRKNGLIKKKFIGWEITDYRCVRSITNPKKYEFENKISNEKLDDLFVNTVLKGVQHTASVGRDDLVSRVLENEPCGNSGNSKDEQRKYVTIDGYWSQQTSKKEKLNENDERTHWTKNTQNILDQWNKLLTYGKDINGNQFKIGDVLEPKFVDIDEITHKSCIKKHEEKILIK